MGSPGGLPNVAEETSVDNPFTRILRRHESRPAAERRRLISQDIGEAIPFVGTAGLEIETLTPTEVGAHLTPHPEVENHVGGMHAAAMALLAETVTGVVVAVNVSGRSVPVLRSLEVDFQRRVRGTLHAVARLSPEQARRIQTNPIGKVEPAVQITDEQHEDPIACAMYWAWLPKERALQ